MKPRTSYTVCVTTAALAFLVGVSSGRLPTTSTLTCSINSRADGQVNPPPTGDQFREGPVLVRLPNASTTTKYIF
ncbi:hypothetical protein IRZ59_21780 [Pseudomonas guariconensis]|uniref:hypothetical protein n=1 Tax=Pseudomonas guariconensis TaxID=1288410 RepID=UPI0018AB7A9B|nr:hypothetical protein [Pseudomonas guariconensis]MBF8733063.1 hypothetical protein [Pseudomonas guariconensis]